MVFCLKKQLTKYKYKALTQDVYIQSKYSTLAARRLLPCTCFRVVYARYRLELFSLFSVSGRIGGWPLCRPTVDFIKMPVFVSEYPHLE